MISGRTLLYPNRVGRWLLVPALAASLTALSIGYAGAIRATQARAAAEGVLLLPYKRIADVDGDTVLVRVRGERVRLHGITGVRPGDTVSLEARSSGTGPLQVNRFHVHRYRHWKWRVGILVPVLLLMRWAVESRSRRAEMEQQGHA